MRKKETRKKETRKKERKKDRKKKRKKKNGVWIGVGCPSLPIHDNIATPRYLFHS